MEKIETPSSLRQKMKFHSSYCDKHARPVQNMEIGNEIVCPRCKSEEANKKLEEKISEEYHTFLQNERYNTLFSKSILEDNTLLRARMDNYRATEPEETQNKSLVWEAIEHYKAGDIFNLILQGKQGTGKSHLAYASLYELNRDKSRSCLFISVDAMLRKIKGSFANKESKYTEEYFAHLLSSVDFLVLDDLGAETGAIDSQKTATDFVQRVLYSMTNARQDKATILTTNLDSKTLFAMYDKKLISRLLRTPRYVIFQETKDKRTSHLPF